jgi:hypothetical protein
VNGSAKVNNVHPDIRLTLYILFVARFSDYASSWNSLAAILMQLQAVPVLDMETDPNLPEGVERLAFEMVTQTFTELNDVWNALRTTHHPSLLYRVRLLTIRDATYSPPTLVSGVSPSIRTWRGP